MEKKNNYQLSNFWFGFVLGGISVLGLGYFFGTKKGRQMLKKALDFFENFEENLASLIKEIERNEKNPTEKNQYISPPLLTSLAEKIRNLAGR